MRGLRATIVAGHIAGSPWRAADRELIRWGKFPAVKGLYSADVTIQWADGITLLCDVPLWSGEREWEQVQRAAEYAVRHTLSPKLHPLNPWPDETGEQFDLRRLHYSYTLDEYVSLCGADAVEKAVARRLLTGHDFGFHRDGSPYMVVVEEDVAEG